VKFNLIEFIFVPQIQVQVELQLENYGELTGQQSFHSINYFTAQLVIISSSIIIEQ
jgi:hypothetical protein